MNKNSLIIAIGALFLIASIIYSYTQKKSYIKTIYETTIQANEIKQIARLQKLWGAKKVTTKLHKALKSLPSDKKIETKIYRSKATLNFKNLTDKELNKIISSLARLPVQFKNLNITRMEEKYSMECLCVW